MSSYFWEGVENLPGGRGFVLTEYEPVGGHGDPICDRFYGFGTRKLACLCLREISLTSLSEGDILFCCSNTIITILVL